MDGVSGSCDGSRMGQIFSSTAAGAALVVICAIAVEVGLIAVLFRIAYALIWRAVRRGMREYYQPPLRSFRTSLQQGRESRD